MERSAVYRRALAPVMLYVGSIGIIGAVVSRVFKIESNLHFIAFWLGVCFVAVSGVFLLVRREAVRSREPFWTPPTRRVAEAMSPAFLLGAFYTVIIFSLKGGGMAAGFLPLIWSIFYGFALHSAGFVMPRIVKVLGWCCMIVPTAILGLAVLPVIKEAIKDLVFVFKGGELLMGLTFGMFHFLAGIYLYFTESRKTAP